MQDYADYTSERSRPDRGGAVTVRSEKRDADLAAGPATLLRLQATAGNRAVTTMLAAGAAPVQREATVAEPSAPLQPGPARPGTATPAGLPPDRNSRPTPESISQLRLWLDAHVAGRALASQTYTFYEVLDAYLGPWGEAGYPIGYGKRYNVLFSTDQFLMADPVAAGWVWHTTVLLQEALVEYVVGRYAAGTLGQCTESELRAAAFASHPRAYTEGGLALVTAVSPMLVPHIVSIPAVEFHPRSPNLGATLAQAKDTGLMVIPRTLGLYLAAIAGPAHTGSLRNAAAQDQRRLADENQLGRYLGSLLDDIQGGKIDDISSLEEITRRLLTADHPDQGFARLARDVIEVANRRKTELALRYQEEARQNPELGSRYDLTQPGWRSWLP